jgi:hypothetical protein
VNNDSDWSEIPHHCTWCWYLDTEEFSSPAIRIGRCVCKDPCGKDDCPRAADLAGLRDRAGANKGHMEATVDELAREFVTMGRVSGGYSEHDVEAVLRRAYEMGADRMVQSFLAMAEVAKRAKTEQTLSSSSLSASPKS